MCVIVIMMILGLLLGVSEISWLVKIIFLIDFGGHLLC
jgi:hypothetical protein